MRVLQVAELPEVYVAIDDLSTALATGPVHADEALRALSMPTWQAREFLGARALLRLLLGELVPDARGAALSTNDTGRPVLPEWPGLGVSLSHHGDFVAAAVGRCPRVGVDVQTPPDSLDEALVERCLRRHVTTLRRLDDADRRVEFAWVWTVQEACVKAQGTGIAGRPWAIDVPPGESTGRWGEYAWTSLRAQSTTPLSCAYDTGVPAEVGAR